MKNLRLKLLLLCVMGIITLGASATPDKNYLCFTANTANSTVELVKNGKAYNVIMQYSTDEGESWQTIDFATATTTGTITVTGLATLEADVLSYVDNDAEIGEKYTYKSAYQ